jgi:hypothetical protein
MPRKQAIAIIKYAGYHNDQKKAMITYIENHVSFAVYMQAYRDGIRAKENGVRCNCLDCNPKG